MVPIPITIAKSEKSYSKILECSYSNTLIYLCKRNSGNKNGKQSTDQTQTGWPSSKTNIT